MLEFINGIKDKILALIEVLLNIIGAGDNIIEILDGITFDGTSQIYQFFSTFRYILGDPMYLVLTSMLILGVSLLLFKMLKIGTNAILSFIPGFNIRLP